MRVHTCVLFHMSPGIHSRPCWNMFAEGRVHRNVPDCGPNIYLPRFGFGFPFPRGSFRQIACCCSFGLQGGCPPRPSLTRLPPCLGIMGKKAVRPSARDAAAKRPAKTFPCPGCSKVFLRRFHLDAHRASRKGSCLRNAAEDASRVRVKRAVGMTKHRGNLVRSIRGSLPNFILFLKSGSASHIRFHSFLPTRPFYFPFPACPGTPFVFSLNHRARHTTSNLPVYPHPQAHNASG